MSSSQERPPVADDSPYGYVPTRSVTIIFLVLFTFSMVLHAVQGIRTRTWWTLPTLVIGGFGEAVGWGGRLWSSFEPTLMDPFLMQITTTIIAPTFMSAANFTVLGFLIRRLGEHYSRLSPRWYLMIFIGLDLGALVVQSIGGAKASMAEGPEESEDGAKIMLYGVAVQMIAMTIYVVCAAEFLFRVFKDKPVRAPVSAGGSEDSVEAREKTSGAPRFSSKTKLLIFAMIFTTFLLFVRAIYRLVELNDGWTGKIITTQLYFNLLDGMPILLVMWSWNILHPAMLLSDEPVQFLKWRLE